MIWRYRLILFALLFSFGVIVSRIFYWQVIKSQELSYVAYSQYRGLIRLSPVRGEIRTSDGFPIVANRISYLVFATPKNLKDKKKASEILSQYLQEDIASISAKLSQSLLWVPLKQTVDAKTKESIKNLKLPGIGFEERLTRFYPEASLAAHILGFVGKSEEGRDRGYFGIEGYYDRLLRGKEGRVIEVRDALGRPILSTMSNTTGGVNGSDLILSIDRAVQFMVERKLSDGIEKYGANGGMVGIMTPKTGNIIAMASYPSFDPLRFYDYKEDLYKNPFIANLYEPGSTIKPLIMAAALDKKLITPQTKCTICGGPVLIGGYEIHTWNDKYFKDTNMIDVIVRSDNTGMVFVAEKLGVDGIIDSLTKFGIGRLIDIDSQGESLFRIKEKKYWYPVDLATASFGQGISVTPIQLLVSFAAIANNGMLMQPHLVSSVQTPDGGIVRILPKVVGNAISEKTAKVMTEMLVAAVNKGEASWAKLKGYRIAGKTGTASIPVAGHYDPSSTITSFIGFAPAQDPKFVMLVILEKPTVSIYGSETAAPLFFDIAKDLLSYYGIPPSE